MEIKLNIGKVIQKPSLKDTFILHVKSMSGDADEYHTNEFYSIDTKEKDRLDRLIRLLEYFVEYSKLGWNEQCNLRDGVLGHESLKCFRDVRNCLEDLIGGDITWDEYYARPDSIWVTYVDSNGLEHYVDIYIEDVAYTKICRSGLEKK